MYFLVIRPQSKRAREHRNLIADLQTGDEVLTSGGILGKIIKIADNFVILKIAENVEVKVQKSAVVMNLPKGTEKTVE